MLDAGSPPQQERLKHPQPTPAKPATVRRTWHALATRLAASLAIMATGKPNPKHAGYSSDYTAPAARRP
jgi:hypothetical protein